MLLVATLAAPLLIRAAREEWLLLLRGAVAFAAGFGMIQLVAYSTPIHWPGEFRHVLETAGQSLVKIREPDLVLHNTPSRDAPVVAVTVPGQRLPLAQTAKTRSAESCLRVAVAPGKFGWLAAEATGAGRAATHQIVPARYGVLEALDLYATLWGVVLSLAVFVRPRPGNARPRSASV